MISSLPCIYSNFPPQLCMQSRKTTLFFVTPIEALAPRSKLFLCQKTSGFNFFVRVLGQRVMISFSCELRSSADACASLTILCWFSNGLTPFSRVSRNCLNFVLRRITTMYSLDDFLFTFVLRHVNSYFLLVRYNLY